MFGSMSLTANGGTTTVGGFNSGYTGATTVNNGATLLGGVVNGFSAASATTINAGGTVDLGAFAQTIDNVTLAGGRLGHGLLTGAVTSTGGDLIDVGGGMSLTTNGGTTTLDGNIAYTGATTVNNGATLTGSGVNAFSAASTTTINSGGTVDLGGFAQAINSVALAGGTLKGGLLNGAVTSTGGTLDGVSGGMSLTTNGGHTTVTGTNTYTGLTTVNGGLLSVNGSIVSDVTVNAGGTLGGNGTVGNTTINGGTLAPGNSIGLLTVQGSLTFTAAASYMVQVSPVSADRTNVTGAATLGDATVNASFAPGTYVAKQYTIVNAGRRGARQIFVAGQHGSAVGFYGKSQLRHRRRVSRSCAQLWPIAGHGSQRQPAERRQCHRQLLQQHRRHPDRVWRADAGRVDAAFRRGWHRVAAEPPSMR